MKRSITVESSNVSNVSFSATDADADDESEEYIFGVQENSELSYCPSLPKHTKPKKPNLRSNGVKNLGGRKQQIPHSIPIRFNAQIGSSKYTIRNSFQEFKIQIDDSTERTPLLSNYSSKPKERSSDCNSCLWTLMALFVFVVVFIGLGCQPITNFQISNLKIVSKSHELFEFDLQILGSNTNIFPIYLDSTDLDVFVGVESTNELLAHVRSFKNIPKFASFGSSSNITARISIIEPDNTLGKIIYTTYPFIITIRGDIWYSTLFNSVHYSIPVCSYFSLSDETTVLVRSCM
jgi:hypothetical protein